MYDGNVSFDWLTQISAIKLMESVTSKIGFAKCAIGRLTNKNSITHVQLKI